MEEGYLNDVDSRIAAIEQALMDLIPCTYDAMSFNRYGMVMVWENILYCLKEIKKLREI